MTLRDRAWAAFLEATRKAIRTDGLEATIVDKVADRPGFATVEVKHPTGIVRLDVRCNKVLPQKGAPVIIRKGRDDQWEVSEDDPRLSLAFWDGKGSGNVGPHAASHGLGGADPLLIDQRALLTLRVSPTVPESTSVYLGPYVYRYAGTWHWWGGDYVDLASYAPGTPSYQKVVIIGLDGSAAAALVVEGDEVYTATNELAFSGDDVRAALEFGNAPSDFIPAAAVRLLYNPSAVYLGDIFLGAKQLAAADLAGGGGGSIYLGGFSPLNPPDTPSSYDDEFNDATLDPKWTEFDHGSDVTPTEAGTSLTLAVDSSSFCAVGMIQALPAGEFTLVTRVNVSKGTPPNSIWAYWAGLLLLEGDLATSPGQLWGLHRAGNGNVKLSLLKIETYDNTGWYVSWPYDWDENTDYFLRLRGDPAVVLYLDASIDGETWYSLSTYEADGTPVYMGIGLAVSSMECAVTAEFDFFRYRAGTDDVTDPCYGSAGQLSHGDLADLDQDDHLQYHTDARGDVRYFRKTEFIDVSTGVPDAGKPVQTDSGGKVDVTLLDAHTHTESDITDLDHDAVKLQGRAVAATAPNDGEALVWSDTNNQWEPGAVSGSASVKQQVVFTFVGDAETGANPIQIPNVTGETKTLESVHVRAKTAPDTQALIVDIHKNGSTLFTTQANRPQVSVGNHTGSSSALDVTSWADGEYLEAEIDQADGADIVVMVVFS
jgi:hypothetical protein